MRKLPNYYYYIVFFFLKKTIFFSRAVFGSRMSSPLKNGSIKKKSGLKAFSFSRRHASKRGRPAPNTFL